MAPELLKLTGNGVLESFWGNKEETFIDVGPTVVCVFERKHHWTQQDTQCMYKDNNNARWCNNCYRVKAISNTYSECVSSLIYSIYNAHAHYYIVICGLSASTIFSTFSDKRRNFREKVVERKMCALIFSKTLSETLIILRSVQRNTIINLHKSSCKVPIILAGFS
jgi:hypothetical protein